MYRFGLFALLSLAACGPGDMTIQASQSPCSDIDLDDPPERDISASVDGLVTTVSVLPFFMECDSVFEPEISVEGSTVLIQQGWDGEAGDCCLVAKVGIKAENSDVELQAQWFDSDGETPAFAIKVQTP